MRLQITFPYDLEGHASGKFHSRFVCLCTIYFSLFEITFDLLRDANSFLDVALFMLRLMPSCILH
jgi:hypothetical protein